MSFWYIFFIAGCLYATVSGYEYCSQRHYKDCKINIEECENCSMLHRKYMREINWAIVNDERHEHFKKLVNTRNSN